MKPAAAIALLALPVALAASCAAQAQDDAWFFRVGAHVVNPRSDNGTLAGGALDAAIDSDARPTFVLGRRLDDHWAVELLASLPFEHTVALNGADAVDFKHLPPTLTLQYYFLPESRVNPFLGLGLNYTWTFDEEERGPLAATEVKVGNSFGIAAHAGLEFDLGRRWNLVADVRWMDIDADVSVDGADVGEVRVDPLVYGVYAGWSF